MTELQLKLQHVSWFVFASGVKSISRYLYFKKYLNTDFVCSRSHILKFWFKCDQILWTKYDEMSKFQTYFDLVRQSIDFAYYIGFNPNAEKKCFPFKFLWGKNRENERKILTLPVPGIDPRTSRTPGKCLSHYTTGMGSQILRICSPFMFARLASADWSGHQPHHAAHALIWLAKFS